MKSQLIVKTPLGAICAEAKECTQEELDKGLAVLEDNISSLAYLSFVESGTGNKIIIPKGILQNSIICITKV